MLIQTKAKKNNNIYFISTHIQKRQRIACRVQNGEQHNREQDQQHRTNVQENQREKQIMARIFEQQQRQEFPSKSDRRQALMETQSTDRCVCHQHFVVGSVGIPKHKYKYIN